MLEKLLEKVNEFPWSRPVETIESTTTTKMKNLSSPLLVSQQQSAFRIGSITSLH
jgi:hypothetical protein